MNSETSNSRQSDGSTVTTRAVRCSCGTLQGVLRDVRSANRVVCYCYDCQAFAYALGGADRILDVRGGSDVIQVPPKNLTFTAGLDRLVCLRLTSKGMLRWYTDCCHTPIGNTLATPKLSFIGLLHSCLASDPIPLDDTFGPVGAHVNTHGAKGSPKPRDVGKAKVVGWFFRTVLPARFNGDYKRTPFFRQGTSTPIVTPRVLSDAELAKAMAAARSS